MRDKTFAIIGGGIGGLTLAAGMVRKGFANVRVFENARQLKPVGAGIVLAANAVKALRSIEIEQNILQEGLVMKRFAIKDEVGRVLTETKTSSVEERFGLVNTLTLHRADLHKVLLELLPQDVVQLGKGCVDFIKNGGGWTLQFNDGTSDYADYIIAADGIHSIFRKKLVTGSTPRYAGYTCWRGIVEGLPDQFDATEATESWGRGHRFGIVPLTGNRIYWFACINCTTPNDPAMRAMSVEQLAEKFKGFHAPVQSLIRATKIENLLWNDIIDVKPIPRFAFDSIVLLGDAAHATTPNMGQGACMAIEDAAVLCHALVKSDDPIIAFRRYETKRIARTTRIVNTSWSTGKIAQLENAILVKLRNTLLKAIPESVTHKQLQFLFEVDFE